MTDQELLTMAAKAAGYMTLTNGQTYSPEAGNFDAGVSAVGIPRL